MKPFLKMDFNSFSVKKKAILLPTLLISLSSVFAFGVESREANQPTLKTQSPDQNQTKNSKTKRVENKRAENESLENQLELFLNGKIKGNSLVLLKEKAPEIDSSGNPIKKPKAEQNENNSLIRNKIPSDSVVTGISCNSIQEFFENEGLSIFKEGSASGKIAITQKTIVEYFNLPQVKSHFSERTRRILLTDFQSQLKAKFNKSPQVCFADIREPSGEKHTVYLTHKNIKTQTADYSPEYELIDFTYDQNYLSPAQETTQSEKE